MYIYIDIYKRFQHVKTGREGNTHTLTVVV